MKRSALILFILAAVAAAVGAQTLSIGGTADNFSLTDTSGKAVTLNDMKGTNGSVFIFVSAVCPVVRAYNERMNQLALDYKAKGINVVGVNANVTETSETIKTHASQTFKFPVMIDRGGKLADMVGASHTPEAYFFNAKNVLVYHGAIDNDRSGRNLTSKYLRSAFDASLAGKKVEPSSVEAFGCTIARTAE